VDKTLLKSIKSEVSGERAWDMMSKISRFHRIRGGGEGSDYNRCVEYLAQELKKLGLKEVRIERFRADGIQKNFLWNSLLGWKVKEAELWMKEPEERLISRFSDQAVSLMPYSNGGSVESEVVFVGEGKSDADYENKNVSGKVVFAIGGDGDRVHRKAVLERGAAGVIIGPADRDDRLQYPDLIEVYRISISGEEKSEAGFGFALSRRQTKELLSIIKSGKKIKIKAHVDAELFIGDMPVLEAKITGTDFPSQEVIVMGHLDHYKPGANDNASGSAGMFEMARNIQALIKRGDICPPKRTIKFLWVPELHGTIPYVAKHSDLRNKGIAGINLDMIGENYYLCESLLNVICSPYSVPGYINDVFINLLGWLDTKDFFSPRGSRLLFNFRVKPNAGGSDHIVFNDSYFSIPTIALYHGDVFHHSSYDTPEKCDPTEMKRIISLTLASTLFIANADDEDAVSLAREVYNNAILRMAKRTQKSIRLLHQYASDDSRKEDLTELFFNLVQYPEIQAQVEMANLHEVKELCQKESCNIMIDKLIDNLRSQFQKEKERLTSIKEIILPQHGIKNNKYKPETLYKEASSMIPQRLFKGPLPWGFMGTLEKEDYEWYQKNKYKAGGYYDSKMSEIINLMDGKRSLLDIRQIISCEYDETDIGFVLHFVKDLKKYGLVKFSNT